MISTLIKDNAFGNVKCFAEKFWQPWLNWAVWVTCKSAAAMSLTSDITKQLLLEVKLNIFFKNFQLQSLWRIGMVFTAIILPKNRVYTYPKCPNKMLLLRASFQYIKQLETFDICIIKWKIIHKIIFLQCLIQLHCFF